MEEDKIIAKAIQSAYERGRQDKERQIIDYVSTEDFKASWVNCPIGTRFNDFLAMKLGELG